MSHFAKVEDGIVTQVIVAEAEFFDTFVDSSPGEWIQTSFNTSGGVHLLKGTPLRFNFAGVGFTYDATRDAFYEPQPYPSWTLVENTCQWTAPTAYPDDGKQYSWDEDATSWVRNSGSGGWEVPVVIPSGGAILSGAMLRGSNGSTVQEWVHSSRATVSPSHTTMYSWYKLVSPGGYSSAGTPGVWDIHCHIAGGHASSAILQKFTLVQSNNHAHIADHGGATHSLCYRFCNIDPGGGAYGVSLTVNCYYLSTDAGNNGATFFFKCAHAAREPHFTFYAKYIGGTGAGIGKYEQSLSFLGTQSNNNHQPEHKTEIPITITH